MSLCRYTKLYAVSFVNGLEPDLNGQVLPLAETYFFNILLFIKIVGFVRPSKRILLLVNLAVSLTVRIAIEDIMLQHEYQVKADGDYSKSKFGRITKKRFPIVWSRNKKQQLKQANYEQWAVQQSLVLQFKLL